MQPAKFTVLHINASYKPAYIYGGPTMSISKLCESLSNFTLAHNLNIDIKVLTTTANGKTELNVVKNKPLIVDGVTVTYFKRITKDHTHFSPALLWHLRKKIIHINNKDKLIIHIHSWWNLVSILSCFIAKYYNVPVVLSPRGMITHYTLNNRNNFFKKTIHNFIGKSLLKYCFVHATTPKEEIDIKEIISPKRVTIIPNIVSLATKTFDVFKPNAIKFKLVFLSRIEEKKGLELLFEALSTLSFNWQLTIAGSGETGYVKSLKLKIESLKIGDKINWIGQVKNEAKFNLLANHDLLVLTSYNENFANVVIESLSVGTPVLISRNVGLSAYVAKNSLGYICELKTTDISAKLTTAYQNSSYLAQIREKAPEMVLKDFNPNKLSKDYVHLYNTILNQELQD